MALKELDEMVHKRRHADADVCTGLWSDKGEGGRAGGVRLVFLSLGVLRISEWEYELKLC